MTDRELLELKKLDNATISAMVNDLRRMAEMMGRENDKAAIEMCRRPDMLRKFADHIEQLQRELEEARKMHADLLAAAKVAVYEMCHTTAPRNSFTDANDALDAAVDAIVQRQR